MPFIVLRLTISLAGRLDEPDRSALEEVGGGGIDVVPTAVAVNAVVLG